VSESKTPWLDIARGKLGQHEVPGNKDNSFILECFLHTTYHASHDEVPWCAAFVCWCLDQAKVPSTKSAAAISFASYGEKCELQPGAIVVFKWENGQHHVSFCDHVIDEKTVACLGGNQTDSVRISNFSRNRIIACRMPHSSAERKGV
jgi:uncharacterized protein (TIGR02594 family)